MRSTAFIFLLVGLLLSGCYCTQVFSSGNVRRVDGAKGYSICGNHPGKELSVEVVPYIGVVMVDSSAVIDSYVADHQIPRGEVDGFMQYGISANFVVRPPFFSLKVLQLGCDYSFDRFSLISQEFNGVGMDQSFLNRRHRFALNMNFITLIRPKVLSYLSFQGGLQRNYVQVINPQAVPVPLNNWRSEWQQTYRGGIGFRFFLGGPFGISAEAGYGGGAYLRTGIFAWF